MADTMSTQVGDGAAETAEGARPDLLYSARRVITVLEPLDAADRIRVLRAATILLGLDMPPLTP